MGGAVGPRKGPMSEINVTPLIDVVLVLLVVFMVITPLLSSGLPVDLPMATQTVTVNDVGQHIVISITKDGLWAVDQDKLADQEEGPLIEAINVAYRENPERSILVKADRKLEYGEVRKLLDILADRNFTSVFIAAGKEN
jgi:biopolymer transport protein TolR